MHINYRLKALKEMFESKLGQDLPGWTYIVMLILGLFVLVFLLWLAAKGGKATIKEVIKLK